MGAKLTTTNDGGTLGTATLTTIENYLPGLADNVSNGVALWRALKERGAMETQELVGREEIITLDVATGDDGQDFDSLDLLSVEPTDELTDARVGHYNYTAATYVGDIESMENSGRAKLRDLLKTRMQALERKIKIGVIKRWIGTQGSTTKRPPGIRDLMGGSNPDATSATDGDATFAAASTQSTYLGLTPGDVDGEQANLWAVHCNIITALGPNNEYMRTQLLDLQLDLQTYMAKPTFGIADAVYYKEFAKMLGGKSLAQYQNVYSYSSDRPAAKGGKFDAGYPDLYYNGMYILYDPYVRVPSTYTTGTDGHCNFIDPNHFKIRVDPRANFKLIRPGPRVGGDEQMVDIYRIWIRYAPWCNKRIAHAIAILNLT